MPKNNYRNQEQDRRLGNVETSIKTINEELGSVKVDMAEVKTNVKWLKDNNKFVVGSSITTLLAILGLLIKLLIQ